MRGLPKCFDVKFGAIGTGRNLLVQPYVYVPIAPPIFRVTENKLRTGSLRNFDFRHRDSVNHSMAAEDRRVKVGEDATVP